MAETSDYTTVNDAATSANWTSSGFDTPTLNNSASTTPIYLEGSACMWWPLKKGTTNGYTYEATPNQDISNGEIVVGFLNYPFSDLDNIPINSMFIRLSSSAGFTTNYAQWDAKAQILAPRNTPISGFTPVMVYPTNPDATSGTPNYADLESFGWVATTGNDADGKQGGFDWFFRISWIGGHSETYNQTFFSQLNTHANPTAIPGTAGKPFGCYSRAGDFYRTNISIKIGTGAGDTSVSVTETSKTIFFDNVEPEHNLGYIFENPATGTSAFFLTNCVHFWNEQDGTNPKIFTTVTNTDVFKLDGCAFARGGSVDLPAHDTATTTYVQNCSFDACGVIDLGDITFEGNTISNAVVGVQYASATTLRSSDNSYSGNTVAIQFDYVGTVTIDGDQFSGNTYDIDSTAGASGGVEGIADSYSETNQDLYIRLHNTNHGVAQSFTGDGNTLSRAVFYLRKEVSPTGNAVAKLYAHSGTFGTSSIPSGTALATSDPFDVSTLTLAHQLINFNFDNTYILTNAVKYCIALEYTNGDATNTIRVGDDNSTPTHAGNSSVATTAFVWTSRARDFCFYVYSKTPVVGGGALTADSYSETNQSTSTLLDASPTAVGQSITGDGDTLSNIRWYIRKVGTPAGNMVAKLYAHSGTFGTSSVPTGTALATSDTVVADSLTTSYALTQFQFSDQVQLVNTIKYVITLEYTGTATNYVEVGTDNTAPTHTGNFSTLVGTWSAVAGTDACFYVSTGGILILNATNGANPSSFINSSDPPGAVIIQNAVTVLITAVTVANVPIQNVRVYLKTDPGGAVLVSGLTDVNGEISVSYNYAGDQDVVGWARKSTASPLYTEAPLVGTITSAGLSATATMILDE